MKKKYVPLLLALIFMVALFTTVAVTTARSTYKNNVANEHFDEFDFYSMQDISEANSKAVFDALKKQDAEALKALMTNSENLDSVLDYADWSELDYKKAVSYGAGSLSPSADKTGRVDVNEKFYIKMDGREYVLFIESLTSRWGRQNEGVSAIAVTSFDNYDSMYSTWNGEQGEYSVLAGELFWQKQRESKDS